MQVEVQLRLCPPHVNHIGHRNLLSLNVMRYMQLDTESVHTASVTTLMSLLVLHTMQLISH